MDLLLNLIYIAIVLCIFLLPGYMLTTEVYRLASGGDKPPTYVGVQGLIPIWNNLVIRKMLYGGNKTLAITYLTLIPVIVLRVIAMVTRNDDLLFVTAISDLLAILLCWIVASYVAIDVGRMVQVTGFKILLCVIVPPLGCYAVARSIGPYMKHSSDEVEDTFLQDERSGD